MKKLAINLIVATIFSFPTLAMAQDTDVKQQTQNINIKILQLSAQRDFNNQLILDLTRRALDFDQQITQLGQQRQALNKPAAKVEPKVDDPEK